MSSQKSYPGIPSVRDLITKHSTARVLAPSSKAFITGYDTKGLPMGSRAMWDGDALQAMVAKYAR